MTLEHEMARLTDAVAWAAEGHEEEFNSLLMHYARDGAWPDVDQAVRLLAAIREARAGLATFYDGVERYVLEMMGEKTLTVEGVGTVEVKRSIKRTKWDHDALVAAVVSRIVDEPGVVYDPVDGSIVPYATIGSNIARRLRECVSFGAGKVTGLRAIGIQPDEYCSEDDGHYQLVLPRREI